MTSHSNLSAASKVFGKIATEQSNPAAAAQTVKTLQIEQTPSGQYRYRIVSTVDDEMHVDVAWQFGSRNKADTILQAEDRFLGNAKYDIESY